MRFVVSTLAFMVLSFHAAFALDKGEHRTVDAFRHAAEVQALTPQMLQMGVEEFLALTPAKYRDITGERLGLKNTMKLKAAQKFLKKGKNLGIQPNSM